MQDRGAACGLNCADYGRRGRGAAGSDELGGEGERRRLDACGAFTRVSEGTMVKQETGC